MSELRFRDLPMVVRLTSVAAMILAWMKFEELVIEGMGIYRALPYYRYGAFCPYDVAALLLIAGFWMSAHRPSANLRHV